MKKILIAALALALPVLASAQVQLMSGYNFGQFLGPGAPSLDGGTGAPVGSVGDNYRLNSQPPNSSSGPVVAANEAPGDYSAGFGRLYWDGSNGSSTYSLAGAEIKSTSVGNNSVNGATVQGYSLAAQGDSGFNALTTAVANNRLAFVQNTTGFMDFDPSLFANGLGVTSDANLTFAARVSAPVTISWFFGDLVVPFATTVLSGVPFASYSVDLPAAFYGVAAAQLVAQFSGTADLDNVQFNGVAAIPEPSTYAVLLGAASLAVVLLRRRKNVVA